MSEVSANPPFPFAPIQATLPGQLYAAYCAAVGGKAFNGDPLPDWETFRADESKKVQSDAWVKVAEAAMAQCRPRVWRPTSAARKAYIAAWKAEHPERQREYARRWRLSKGAKVCGPRRNHMRALLELSSPFTAKQYSVHTGMTWNGTCNLFKTLLLAGKIRTVGKNRNTRLYEVAAFQK